MKRIIDIDKDYYEIIKYEVEHGHDFKPYILIANSTSLEDIKAEIESLNPVDYGSMFSYESHNGAKDMKNDIINILDKHIGGKG